MTNPDITDLCERLRAPKPGVLMDITGRLHPKDRANPDGPQAADTLQRQAAEIGRLREALPDLSAVINWLAKGCAVDHAVTELIIYQARIDAALTGEDAATLGLSGKTQTDARTRGDG